MIGRRGFIAGLASALAAPAIVSPSSLMKLWVPPPLELNEANLLATLEQAFSTSGLLIKCTERYASAWVDWRVLHSIVGEELQLQ